jgi:hypothetical protein
LFLKKELSKKFGTFRHDNYGKKKKPPISLLFKIDDEDV